MASSENADSNLYIWLSPTFIISLSCDSCCSVSQIGVNNVSVVIAFISVIPQNRSLKNLGNYKLCHRRLDMQMCSTACMLFTLAYSVLLVEYLSTAFKQSFGYYKLCWASFRRKFIRCFFIKVWKQKWKNQKLLEDDKNRLFLLSLVKEMKTMSKHLKTDAKFYILIIFKKYQSKYMFPCPVSQFHHAPGPSHCCPSNPSYSTPLQVPCQDSSTQ
jgi:hypothetical protein